MKCSLIWLLLPLAAVTTGIAAAEAIQFKFNPPDKYRELQQLRTVISLYVNDHLLQRDVQELTAAVYYRKRSDGWRMESVLRDFKVSRNEQPLQAPTLEGMRGRKLTYIISPVGELIAIDGYDGVVKGMLDQFPREVRKEMAQQIRVEDLVEREKLDWQSRYSRFLGKTVQVGDVWADEEDVGAGDATAHVHRRTILHSYSPGQPLKLRLAWHSDGEILERITPIIVAQFDDLPLTTPPDLELAIFGKGERTLDPATMLMQKESIIRIIAAIGKGPKNKPVPVVRIEEKTYTFTPDTR